MTTRSSLLAITSLLAVSTACKPEQGFFSEPVGQIAVAAGDFDDIADPLDRVPVDYQTYQGIISVATWDPEWDYGQVQGTVEGLLGEGAEIFQYQTTFVASGVRGLGERQYNGLDPDNQLVTDPVVIENVRNYVQNRRVNLVVTDWGYDLVEAAWPDAIDFLGDDGSFDDAQHGEISDIVATVENEALANALGSDTMGLEYNYSNWAVIEDVGPDTEVWIRGDASYRVEAETGPGTMDLTGVPMLVTYQPPGALGKVVYASFHIDAQSPGAIDTVLEATIGDFKAAEPIFEPTPE